MLALVSIVACAGQPETNPRDAADANDTGGRLAAHDASERTLLSQLAKLPSGAPQRMGDATVLAFTPYQAASGQTCRALELTSAQPPVKRHRLACSDGKAWFFVPDVFGRDASE